MIRNFVLFAATVAPSAAFAHVGHVADAGHGHGHWAAIALLAGAGIVATGLAIHAMASRSGRSAEET